MGFMYMIPCTIDRLTAFVLAMLPWNVRVSEHQQTTINARDMYVKTMKKQKRKLDYPQRLSDPSTTNLVAMSLCLLAAK